MAKLPEWALTLRRVETLQAGRWTVGETLDAWLEGAPRDQAHAHLTHAQLGAHEAPADDGVRRLLAVPMRVNSLAQLLGATYWQTLRKANRKILVSDSGRFTIGDVRHHVIMLDVAAWRAWSLEHREPEAIGAAELLETVQDIRRINDEIKQLGEIRKERYDAAGKRGFDVKALRAVVKILDSEDGVAGHMEHVGLVDLYLGAIEGEDDEDAPAPGP